MAKEETVMSQAEIDALVAKVPPKPAEPEPDASQPEPQPEPVPETGPPTPAEAAVSPPPPVMPVSSTASYQKYTSNEVGDIDETVKDLSREVSKLMSAMQRLAQLENKMTELSVLLKVSPDATETLKQKFDDITSRLDSIQRYQSNIQAEFQCSKCQSRQMVAIHVKCTSCGDESWMGWWPDKNSA